MSRYTVLLLVLLRISDLFAPHLRGDEPDLIKQAAKAIDLSQLPLYGGEKSILKQRVECLLYRLNDASKFQEITEFHQKQLEERGGKLISPPEISRVSDARTAGILDLRAEDDLLNPYEIKGNLFFYSFSKFIIRMEVTVAEYDDMVGVSITNHGHLKAKSLPRNSGLKLRHPVFQHPDCCSFSINPTTVSEYEKIIQKNHDLLIRSGWSLFGTKANKNTCSLYRKDAVYLTVYHRPPLEITQFPPDTLQLNPVIRRHLRSIQRSHHQTHRAEVTYSLGLSSFDDPAPPEDIEEFQHLSKLYTMPLTPIEYAFTTSLTEAEIIEYYRTEFEKREWKEVPLEDLNDGSLRTLTFENNNRDQAHLEIGQKNGKSVVNVWTEDRLEVLKHENGVRKAEDLKRDQQRSEPSSADILSSPP